MALRSFIETIRNDVANKVHEEYRYTNTYWFDRWINLVWIFSVRSSVENLKFLYGKF